MARRSFRGLAAGGGLGGISTFAAALKRMPCGPVLVELHRLLGNAQPLIAALAKTDPQWRQTEAARRAVGRFVAVLGQIKSHAAARK